MIVQERRVMTCLGLTRRVQGEEPWKQSTVPSIPTRSNTKWSTCCSVSSLGTTRSRHGCLPWVIHEGCFLSVQTAYNAW